MKNYFLGIDVSKGYADFSVLDPSIHQVLKPFKLLDTADGHNNLIKIFNDELKEAEHIYCGVESTGGYEDNWYRTLSSVKDDRVKIVRINPVRIHHQSKAKLDRTITDAVASTTIGFHLTQHYKEMFEVAKPDVVMANARKVYNLILVLNKQKTRLSNQLEKIIYCNIPELVPFIRKGMPKWVLNLLHKFPGKDYISKARRSSITKIKGITPQKAKMIQDKVKSGIGSVGDMYIAHTIKSLTSKILDLTNQILEEKKFLIDNLKDYRADLIQSIKGIGAYTAIGVLIEIEDINRFEKSSNMSSYFGVHPIFKKSGDGSTKARMSKKGRSSYRNLLFMGARNVVNHNPYFKDLYADQRSKGMNDTAAIGVIMHKLTRVIFGILKTEKPFDPKVDKKNKKEAEISLSKQEIEQAIIHQKQELQKAIDAPFSARKVKKIKKKLNVSILLAEEHTRSKTPSDHKNIKNI